MTTMPTPQLPTVPTESAPSPTTKLVNFSKQYLYILIAGILVIGAIVTTLILTRINRGNGNNQDPQNTNDTANTQTDVPTIPSHIAKEDPFLPECTPQNSLMSQLPINFDSLNYIAPLGNFNPNGGHVFPTEHIYLYLKKPVMKGVSEGSIPPYETPLYAPADMWITAIRASEHLSESPKYTDYGLEFALCKTSKGNFGHVTSISSTLTPALVAPYQQEDTYKAGGKTYHAFTKETQIFVKAGEKIGTVGGRSGQNALDISFYDYMKPALIYANPARWENNERQLYATCAVDYFAPELKARLEAKLGGYVINKFQARTGSPICGEVNQDIANTAQGVWLIKNTTNVYPEDPHVTLAHDNFDPSIGVFSIGTSLKQLGVPVGMYKFAPASNGLVNRDFKGITADGNVYCYNLSSNNYSGSSSTVPALLVQMPTSTTLKIGTKSGTCGSGPWTIKNSVEFER